MRSFSDGCVGQNCRTKLRMLKNSGEVFCRSRRERFDEIDGRRGLGRRLAEERRERLRLVTRLHLLHVVKIVGAEELRAVEGKGELGLGAKTFFTPFGVSPLQRGPATRKLPPSLPVVRLPM